MDARKIQTSQKANALALTLLGLWSPFSSAAQRPTIDCGVAYDLSFKAYEGVRNALAEGDKKSAYRIKDVFWDIERYSPNCADVRMLGNTLTAHKLGVLDKLPRESPVPRVQSGSAQNSSAQAIRAQSMGMGGRHEGFSGAAQSVGGTYGSSGTSGTSGASAPPASGTSGQSGTSGASETSGHSGD